MEDWTFSKLAKVYGGLHYLQTMVTSHCNRKENNSKVVTVASNHKMDRSSSFTKD